MSWTTSNNMISYENNAMLAAILFLLLVILFVLLLHIYARWLLGQRANAPHPGPLTIAQVLGPTRRCLPRSTSSSNTTTTYTYDVTSSSATKGGLDSTSIDAIPLFFYGKSNSQDDADKLECAICLSLFEEREVGRSLPRCSHAFHVGCIDMWLHSHATCPVCRAQVVLELERTEKFNDHDDDHRAVEIEDGDDAHHVGLSEIVVVEIMEGRDGADDDHESVGGSECSPTSDCSLRRMLSWTARSENRVHPSTVGTPL